MTQPPPLPDNIIEGLRQLVNDTDTHQWATGDYLAAVVDELGDLYHAQGVRYPRAWLISHMAARIGCDGSTLRDRESMARFYPAPVRDRYAALTYHQLRACKSAGPEWEKYAAWALVNLPAPVAVIRSMVKNGGDLPPAWVARWERIQVLGAALADDPLAPAGLRLICRLIMYWSAE